MKSAQAPLTRQLNFLPPLQAISAIRPLIGRSGPFLIRASDGSLNVLKTAGNSRHPNLLANEFLGSALCAAVGLPIATGRTIGLSRSFLEKSDLSARYGEYTHIPEPGVHYASRLVEPHNDRAFTVATIGRNLAAYVKNKPAFLGMYLLDVCVQHRDQRQAVFIKEKGGPASRAVFVDHSHMFGGSKWDLESPFPPPTHRLSALYDGLSNRKDVTCWLKAFSAKLPDTVDSMVKSLPSEWYTGSLTELQAWLHHRIKILPNLVDQELERAWVFRKHIDATLHVQGSGVLHIGT